MLLFLLTIANPGLAYNIDTESAKKWERQSNDGLFGHSVALSRSYIYVGAPKDDKHGNVFRCSTSGSRCSKIDGKI